MRRQKERAVSEPSAMARVVDSERAWRDQLAAARGEAEALVTAAGLEAQQAAAKLERMLPELIAARKASRDAEVAREIAAVADEAGRAAARLESFTDDAVRRLADDVVSQSPWLRSEGRR